jgi:hypothetical protein
MLGSTQNFNRLPAGSGLYSFSRQELRDGVRSYPHLLKYLAIPLFIETYSPATLMSQFTGSVWLSFNGSTPE